MLAALALVLAAHASPSSDAATGIVALDSGDYPRAVEKLEAALADPSKLKANRVGRAREALGKARGRLAQAGEPSLWLPAIEALAHCLDDERVGESCRNERDTAGIGLLNHASKAADGEALLAALEVQWPGTWLVPYGRAMRMLDATRTTDAAMSVLAAHERLGRGAEPADLHYERMVFRTLIDLSAAAWGPDEALARLERMVPVLEARAPSDRRAEVTEDAAQIRATILDQKARWDERKAKAMAPDAAAGDVGQAAALLDHWGRDEEVDALWQAYTMRSPDDATGWMLWGLQRYNRAAALQQAKATEERVIAALSAAKPQLERAYALDPKDPQVLQALVTITGVDGDAQGLRMYLEAQRRAAGAGDAVP